jgi:D-alanyl-D-alanine dipeptidase
MRETKSMKIPVLGWPANAGSYAETSVDRNDPRAAEPLVRLADAGIAGESYYARTDGRNPPYNAPVPGALPTLWARQTVVEKLRRVNDALAEEGVELFVLDAYRPVACQEGLWRFFWETSTRVKPELSDVERRDYVLNFVADPTDFSPDDSLHWPAHSCGGAIDVTLRRKGSNELLDMGVGYDVMDPLVYSDAFERKLVAHEIALDDLRLLNRRLLYAAMIGEGFMNYPLEFWHFDYGDQMYAFHKRLLGHRDAPAAAWYGTVASPEKL